VGSDLFEEYGGSSENINAGIPALVGVCDFLVGTFTSLVRRRAGWETSEMGCEDWGRIAMAADGLTLQEKIPTSRARDAREMGHPADQIS
jgi:hypothetical protein